MKNNNERPETASPFTAVKWSGEQPLVQFENEWYPDVDDTAEVVTALAKIHQPQVSDSDEAIQRAYYLKANNPANTDTLVGLASEIGLEPVLFESRLHSEALQQQLIVEIADARALPIQGFPSLVLQTGSELIAIPNDFLDGEATYQMIIDSLEA